MAKKNTLTKNKEATFAELQAEVISFVLARGWKPPVKNLATSIMIESAELVEKFQWDQKFEYDSATDARHEEIANELADILIYAFQFAHWCNIDIPSAVRRKLEHNGKKYPVKMFKNGEHDQAKYLAVKKAYRAGRGKV